MGGAGEGDYFLLETWGKLRTILGAQKGKRGDLDVLMPTHPLTLVFWKGSKKK